MTLIELRQHILNRLGAPVINIEIAKEQMDIYIEDTVDKFIEVHYDGLDEGYIFLDLVSGTTEYALPETIHSVISILSTGGLGLSDEPLLVNPYLVGNYYVGNDMYAGGNYINTPSVLDIEMYDQSIASYRSVMEKKILFEYNSTTNFINILATPKADKRVALRVHASPVEITTIYENNWVKKYSTALCKIAWGQNVGKFEGATLPGGVSLNYQLIIEEGKQDKEELETELYERYQEPVDMFFG